MTHVHAAAETERLPWLHDDVPVVQSGFGRLLGLATVAIIVVAAVAYWIGMNSPLPSWPPTDAGRPEATISLPEAGTAEPIVEDTQVMPQVTPAPAPAVVPAPVEEVRPAPVVARQVAAPTRPKVRASTVASGNRLRQVVRKQAAPAKVATNAQPSAPVLWTSWESAGASGRMVRIGTYSSSGQAKRAWRRLVKVYPGMRRLRAVVTDIPSARNGRTFYRLQFGTSSQAHSEVLCQRMRTIGQSCVVVDLAGARARNQDVGQPVGL